jgi:hypothetical protein
VTARRRSCRLGLGCALIWAAIPGEAQAREPSRRLTVELQVDPCIGVPADVIGRVLTVELGASVTSVIVGPDAPEPPPKSDTTTIALSCEEETIRMSVRDPVSGKRLERHIDLRAQRASARPRLLSLSAAELVAASWIELESTPRPSAAIVEATAPPAMRAEAMATARATAARRVPSPWDLEAVVVGRRFPDAGLTTWGGGVAAAWSYQGWLGFSGDLLGETGSVTLSDNGLTLGNVPIVTGSGRLSARLRRTWPSFLVEGGFGARVMLSRLRGNADEAPRLELREHALNAIWGGPMAEVRVGWTFSRWALVVASLEGGTVTRQVAGFVQVGGFAAKKADLVLSGSWAALSIGLGLTTEPQLLAH